MGTILITGPNGGIGRAVVKIFQTHGWNVVATMRSPEKGQDLAALPNVIVTRLDVTDANSINESVQAGIDRFGAIDILINNAGYGVYAPLEAIPSKSIREQFEVNVFGYLDTIKAILPHFRKRRSGLIINISSIGGVLAFPLGTLYHGAKWAVEGMSEALSFELREIGIGVKLVEPGDVLTDFKIEMPDASGFPEYQPLLARFTDCYAPVKAQGSAPVVIAETIFEAATDGADRLRYAAGHDAIVKMQTRKEWSEAQALADMRTQFKIAEVAPMLSVGK